MNIPSSRRAFTLIELLVVIAIIAILAAILFPVFAQAKAAAKKSVSLSNSKQLGTATAIYLQDNDDTYFFSSMYSDAWPQEFTAHKAVYPYTKNVGVFYDGFQSVPATAKPGDQSPTTNWGGWIFNVGMAINRNVLTFAVVDKTTGAIINNAAPVSGTAVEGVADRALFVADRSGTSVTNGWYLVNNDANLFCVGPNNNAGRDGAANLYTAHKLNGGVIASFMDGHAKLAKGKLWMNCPYTDYSVNGKADWKAWAAQRDVNQFWGFDQATSFNIPPAN